MIDLLGLQPSAINKTLSGKTLLLSGAPKIGKSDFCANSPKTLILDFENGYNAHPGVYRVPVMKWVTVKEVLGQLRRPEIHEKFDNVAIDVVSEAWDLCTSFVCSQFGVQKIGDIPYGQGYSLRDAEFETTLREIINLNYGLILTAHLKEKPVEGSESMVVAPDLDKRCLPIVNSLVDIISVIHQTWNEKGESERWLITKSTPYITAGSRWANLEPKIPFGYKYLEEALAKAIEESEANGALVIEAPREVVEVLNFNDVMNEAKDLWTKLLAMDRENNARILSKKIEIIFGHPMKLSETTEDQIDLLTLMITEMKELINSQTY